jgi:ATP-dependent helicase/nuclease subunit B
VSLTVVPTSYGPAASSALHDAVRVAKRDEALAPVTVVVPTNSVGVAARRRLASGELGPLASAGRGIAGVTFLTVYRLAELLAAPTLAAANRRPVSTPVVASAVRGVLTRAPGVFASVASHPATEEALVAAHRELADLDDAQLDLLAQQHPRAREVVRVHRAARGALREDWYDERDLMRTATQLVSGGTELLGDFGTIVCFLPQRWSPPAAQLVGALAQRSEVVIVAGLTGSPKADAVVLASLARVGAKLDDDHLAAIEKPRGSEIISTTDPDDEVRNVVRGVVDAMRSGVPLERMAILYGADDPYARLLHEHLLLAEIPHNGASVRVLSDSVLGRSLLRLLSVGESGFRRDAVCGLFAAAPVLDGRGRPVPAVAWERISRAAGVVGGIEEWRSRLDTYAARQPDDERGARERAGAVALREFVDALANTLVPARAPASWGELAQWAHTLIRRFLGTEARRVGWPEFEQDAARRVEALLDRLAGLDTVDQNPSAAVFRRTLEIELDGARDRIGRLGEGVLVGPPSFALGVDLERVWVCGLAEGLFPAVPHDDPLLADTERASLDGDLRLRAERVDDDERAVLAALASTSGDRILTMPRGDLRRSTEHVPSRFLADTTAAVPPVHPRVVASYVDGLARVEFPASRHELGVRGALARAGWVGALPEVARGRSLTTARASRDFTRYDGNLATLGARLAPLGLTGTDRSVSPTRLELWAGCPHAYFVRHVLHIEPVERPEEVLQLSPLDRGSIIHEVLDRFLREGAQAPWTDRDRTRLHEIADEECAGAVARGVTGRRLLWDRERRLMTAELDDFLTADGTYRSERHAETLATELAFGVADATMDAVEFALSDGRQLRLRGKADRVDRAGHHLIVIDYKTGSHERYVGLGPDNPVDNGHRLQLPVYAYAARAAFGAPETPVEAAYWFVGRGENRLIGYDVDAQVDEVFDATVRAIVDGIEAGCFVANPPPPGPRPFVSCQYCDPDGLGTADRWRDWERKYAAPELDGYRALLEGDEEEEA